MSLKFQRDPPQLNPEEKKLADRVAQLAEEMHDLIDMASSSPDREHAQAKLQECVMWAFKAISEHR